MDVLMVWPDCTYRNGEWHHEAIPSYWIRVPSLDAAALGRHPAVSEPLDDVEGDVYLLVARDLSSVTRHEESYPVSPQWVNGSPFVPIEPSIQIDDLDEVGNLPVER